MKFGLYSDPHVTKKVQGLSDEWENSVIRSFEDMYETFRSEEVDFVICAGDFFDKAVLEARNVPLINKLRNIMSIKTYLLLGNHEIDSNEHNILEAFSDDDKLIPVTSLSVINDILFIPYSVELSSVDFSKFKDKIVITHHDIYGSDLAGGIVKASFGHDPNIFNDCKVVFNGHIHLRSKVGKVFNIGSLLCSQFGELREGVDDHPMYYIYDMDKDECTPYENHNSLYYVTCSVEDFGKVVGKTYRDNNVVLRVSYKDESISDIPNLPNNVLKLSMKKVISKDNINSTEIVKNSTHIDIREMISSYIDKDESVLDSDKDRLKSKCLEVLGG